MKNLTVLVSLTVLAGAGISLLIIPSPLECGFFLFKTRDYVTAQRAYEEQLETGRWSQDTVVPLATIYRQLGAIEKAVKLLEQFTVRYPSNRDAKGMLIDLYREAGMYASYMDEQEDELESVEERDRLRELVGLYHAKADYEKLEKVLSVLHANDTLNADEMRLLAFLRAKQGELDAAIELLMTLYQVNSRVFDSSARKTLFKLLFEQGRTTDAGRLAREWYARGVPQEEAVAFGYWLINTGNSETVLSMSKAAKAPSETRRNFDEMLLSAELAMNNQKAAFHRLAGWREKNWLTDEWVALYAELALAEQKTADYIRILPRLKQIIKQTNGDPYVESVYRRALEACQCKEELAEYWSDKLEDPTTIQDQKIASVYALFGLQRFKDILPTLEEWAKEKGGTWLTLYNDVSVRLGIEKRRVNTLMTRAEAPDASIDERRILVAQLLSSGYKNEAKQVLMGLAKNAAPESPDVKQLMHLWGPRPPRHAVDWLERHARVAPSNEKRGWLEYLLSIGEYDSVVRIINDLGLAQDVSFLPPYVAALAALGKPDALKAPLQKLFELEKRHAKLEEYARLAYGIADEDLSRLAAESVLRIEARDAPALRTLGLLTYTDGNWREAEQLLRRYLDVSGNDYEASYFYAETLTRLNQHSEARSYYLDALKMMNRLDTMTPRLRLVEANILSRVGDVGEAEIAFKRLHNEFPRDESILSDYLAFLLENGLHEQADTLLATP